MLKVIWLGNGNNKSNNKDNESLLTHTFTFKLNTIFWQSEFEKLEQISCHVWSICYCYTNCIICAYKLILRGQTYKLNLEIYLPFEAFHAKAKQYMTALPLHRYLYSFLVFSFPWTYHVPFIQLIPPSILYAYGSERTVIIIITTCMNLRWIVIIEMQTVGSQ